MMKQKKKKKTAVAHVCWPANPAGDRRLTLVKSFAYREAWQSWLAGGNAEHEPTRNDNSAVRSSQAGVQSLTSADSGISHMAPCGNMCLSKTKLDNIHGDKTYIPM